MLNKRGIKQQYSELIAEIIGRTKIYNIYSKSQIDAMITDVIDKVIQKQHKLAEQKQKEQQAQ